MAPDTRVASRASFDPAASSPRRGGEEDDDLSRGGGVRSFKTFEEARDHDPSDPSDPSDQSDTISSVSTDDFDPYHTSDDDDDDDDLPARFPRRPYLFVPSSPDEDEADPSEATLLEYLANIGPRDDASVEPTVEELLLARSIDATLADEAGQVFVEVHPDTPVLELDRELDRDRRGSRAFAELLQRQHPEYLAHAAQVTSDVPKLAARHVQLVRDLREYTAANDREREALERREALHRVRVVGEDLAGGVLEHLVALADIHAGAILGGITSASPELRALSGSPSVDAARVRLTNLLELVERLPFDYSSRGGRLRRLAGRGRAVAAAGNVPEEVVDAMTAAAVDAHVRATRCATEPGFFRATYGEDPVDATSPLEKPGGRNNPRHRRREQHDDDDEYEYDGDVSISSCGNGYGDGDRTSDRTCDCGEIEEYVVRSALEGASAEDVYLLVLDREFRARALGPTPSAARRSVSRGLRVVSDSRPRGTVCGNVPAPRLEVFAEDASTVDGARRCVDDWRGRPPHVVRGGYPYAALTGRDGACAEDLFASAAADDAAREFARRFSGGGGGCGGCGCGGGGGSIGGPSRTHRPRRARGRRGRIVRGSDASG